MNQNRYYRKHPRSYLKNNSEDEENTLILSTLSAVGILAFSFANGILLGYMWKKNRC